MLHWVISHLLNHSIDFHRCKCTTSATAVLRGHSNHFQPICERHLRVDVDICVHRRGLPLSSAFLCLFSTQYLVNGRNGLCFYQKVLLRSWKQHVFRIEDISHLFGFSHQDRQCPCLYVLLCYYSWSDRLNVSSSLEPMHFKRSLYAGVCICVWVCRAKTRSDSLTGVTGSSLTICTGAWVNTAC